MESIIGTGAAFPERYVTNEELAARVDTSDEWIRSRTGIASRCIVEKETAVSLAVEAARKALENSSVLPEEIDLIITATGSSEQIFPCTACEVQAQIGAVSAGCFDLNAACTGFVSAYQMAVGQLRAGLAKNVLIIGTEALSHLVDWDDRSTCILFGDGAGAVLVTTDGADATSDNLGFILRADGTLGNALTCSSGIVPGNSTIQMDGRAIYQFAVKKVPEMIQELLRQNHLVADDIDYYILHQANSRIIDSIAKHLEQPEEKFPRNLMNHGNISSASIPVLLDQLNREGKLKKGMKIVLAAFGAGLTWGGTIITW